MKRSIYLFFAFMLFFVWASDTPVVAQPVFSNGSLILLTDNDGNGYPTLGDVIRVQVTATTSTGLNWGESPNVNLSPIGQGVVFLNNVAGTDIWRADVVLNQYMPTLPNFTNLTLTISAIDIVTGTTNVTLANVDIVQVDGNNAHVAPAVTARGGSITITINDGNYQSAPNGGTIATVDLTPIGGANNTAMVPDGAGGFSLVYSPPNDIEYHGPLTITLKDPFYAAQTYQTNFFTVDTIPPVVDFAGTNVIIMSGNPTALPGDVLRITARVNVFDNETVEVRSTALDNTVANPPINTASVTMPIINGGTIASPTEWRIDVVLSEGDLKNTSLPITFRFTDDAGNVVVTTRYIPIDLDKPYFITLDADVRLPDSSDSPYTVATTSCQIKIVASVPIDVPPDTLTVTADMSPIGGTPTLTMTQNLATGNYEGVYTIPAGTLEDTVQWTFVVSAKDAAGNLVAQATTPAVSVDSKAPVISNLLFTAPGTYLKVGDVFTISLDVEGIEAGSVSVDLSQIGMSSTENIPSAGGNSFSRSFTLQTASITGVIRDAYTSFRVSVTDTVVATAGVITGHLVTQNTTSIWVDNEPAVITSAHINTYHNWYPADDFGFVRVADYLSFHAQTASDPVSVKINMSGLGGSPIEPMIASGSGGGWYDYIIPSLATGTINGANVTFSMSVTDDAGNVTFATLTVPIDNQPIDLSGVVINTSYKPGRTDNDFGIINLNKHLDINVPYSIPSPDDSATGTIDLTSIGQPDNVLLVKSGGNYSISTDTLITDPSHDWTGYKFKATVSDSSGNRTVTQSPSKTVDCYPPSILSASVTILSGAGTAKIGDDLKFEAQVSDNESTAPTIDLSSLGGAGNQVMSLNTSTGKYEYTMTIATGTLDGSSATSWIITAWDNAQNYVTAPTNAIVVDNVPPQIAGGMVVSWTDSPVDNIIKLGDSVTFVITIADPANHGAAILDLTAMGGSANVNMTYNVATNTFSANFIGAQTNNEYSNYVFKAKVTDANGNIAMVSAPALGVDCQATTFTSNNIYISEDNADNPFANIANVNDVITIYASASAYIDATVYATIASGATDFATATMILNPSLNRHETTFTVSSPGINNWPDMGNSNITYKLTAIDDAGNIATMTIATSSFTVRNATPTIAVATFTFNPNNDLQYSGSLPVINIASSSPVDAFTASVQLANGDQIYEAKLDLSDLGTSDINMSVSGDSANTATGILVTDLPALDYVQKTLTIFVKDEGGMTTSTSTTVIIDNIAPTITGAEFNGKTLTVSVSEEISNLDLSQWQIVGSNPLPLNTPAYLPLQPNFSSSVGLYSFDVVLTQTQQQTIAQWASTPLYIQVSNASAPLTDRAENWMEPENYHSINITDSGWREPPRVTQVTMHQNWPSSIEINLMFNKDMDPATLVASSAVLLVSNISYDFTNPDYTIGYIFQPTDTITWSSPRDLKISLSQEGMDWIAAKLTNNTAQKLKFATRSSAHIFAYDTFGKVMESIPTSAPIEAVDDRPVPAFDFYGPPFQPILDIASKTLILHASDRVRLFSNDFEVLDINDPRMASPTPTLGLAVTTFHNKILFHDIDKGTNTTFVLENLEIPSDNAAASSTITLKLTDQDLQNVFNLYLGNVAPVWRLQVNAEAFHNWWGTPNNAYMPSGIPGQMTVIAPTGYNPAAFAACSMSDKPPFNQHNATELVFEVEVSLPDIDGVEVPIQTLASPSAKIFRQDTSALLSNGTFVNWTSRVVDGENRAVARFYNTTSFPTNLQAINARIEVSGITDIFGNTYNVVASQAYDLNTKNDAYPQGFTDIASADIVIDTRVPQVVGVTPATAINVIPAGSPFTVTFDEPMDTTVAPSLRLATSTFIMGFTFASWISSTTAQFINNSAFTSATLNGTWNYEVTGGEDAASNLHVGPSIFPVQVRTHPPEIQLGRIHLKTIQDIIDSSATLTDQAWNTNVPNLIANFSIEYDSIPTEYLPHRLNLYDSAGNLIGQSLITTSSSSTLATATFSNANFFVAPGAVGPISYTVRVVDTVLNETATITSVIYDNIAPDLATFDVTNIGSSTANVLYYSQSAGDFGVSVTTFVATDDLRLALYSYNDNATTTYTLTQFIPNKYSYGMGSTLPNGSYTLTIVDMAGNVATGFASKNLVADNTRPTVVSIDPLDGVGNAPAMAQQFKVVFSEAMDADPALLPTLTLATSSATIDMTFTHWADATVATTAYYTNTNAITSVIPVGTYTYRVLGGKDLAHNDLISPADMDFPVVVYSHGPVAIITNLTLQSHLYPTAQTGLDFNPAFGNGSATLNIDYTGGPFYTPHYLTVFNGSNVQVGTSTASLPVGDPISIHFPTDITWSTPLTDDTYYFRIRDGGGNMVTTNFNYPLTYDTVPPNISVFDIHNSYGIATDTGMGTAFHFSPTLGTATCDITTVPSDKLKMVVLATGTLSTYTLDMTQGSSVHSVDIGNIFPSDGYYIVTATDYAGNMAGGSAPSTMIYVDTVNPTVTNAMPVIAGGIPAGTGIFDVTFDEPMNTTSATLPVLIVATDTAVLNMTFQSWISSQTCRFTNAVPIDSSLPVGTYTYHVTGALDLAGNQNIDPASGSYEIQLFTTPPAFSATLRSQQNLLYGNTELINRAFSINAAPGVATLSVSYTEGPFQVPHSVLVYDSTNTQVASIALNPNLAIMQASATVDASFFGTPGNVGPSVYSFRLVDSIGNVSATSSTLLTYDALAPNIQVATITQVSNATDSLLYYNNQLYGDLNVTMQTDAIDDLLLTIASTTATYTYAMTSASGVNKSVNIPATVMAGIPEGIYTINAFDLAGNAGYGAGANKLMVIDRTPPTVTSVVVTGGTPITSKSIGQATFTVTFSEPMNRLASASPVVTLATTSKIINFAFSSWLSTTQAVFVNAEAITPDIPQGDYRCSVTGYDLTGNKASIYSAATISVRSRGPIVSSFVTHSYQATTASGSSEVKTDMPFSFNVASGISTMSIQLSSTPDTLPTYLHFMQSDVTVASYPVSFNASNAATFTWSITNGPAPTSPTTYIIKLTDGDGDFSLESYSWTMDASAPVVMTATIEGGEVATSAVYFNPSKHGHLTAKFSSVETEAPLLRVQGSNSTDTYQMGTAGTNMWGTNYDGRYSRGSDPKPLAPDGIYSMTIVDKAGNVGQYSSGGVAIATFVIDTAYPQIATYTLSVAGVPVTEFAPAGGNLDITLSSPESLSETGVFWIKVLNSSGITVNKLPLSLIGSSYVANWNGKDSNGNKVIDGSYKFIASDYAGNVATGSITVDVIASAFKVMGAEEISANSVKLWFSQKLDAATIGGAVVNVSGGLTASSFTIAEPQALVMTLNSSMVHNTSYTFTVATGTVTSIYGVGIAGPDNVGILVADSQGPVVSDVTFDGLSGQQEFKVVFDEVYKASTASDLAHYSLTGPTGNVPIANATIQSDQKTVLLTASSELVERANYTITVTDVEDLLGNKTPTTGNSYNFVGRDLTPPVLEVGVFSNPINEYDIIVVVTANEGLQAPPTLQIQQSNAPVVTTTMQQGSASTSYMIGVHLSPSYPGNGSIVANATDLAGNAGTGNTTFAVAYVSSKRASYLFSSDKHTLLKFNKSSLKSDSLVKIFTHPLKLDTSKEKTIKTSMKAIADHALGNIRASKINNSELKVGQSELVPTALAYEIGVDSKKIANGFNLEMATNATNTTGLGLFKQNGDAWQFISANKTSKNNFYAILKSQGIYAILRDKKPPSIAFSSELDLNEPFRTDRPEFKGSIEEFGSGIDLSSVEAHIDGGPAQKVLLNKDGSYTFKAMAPLTGGMHSLEIKASDRTKNSSVSPTIRFKVVVPLAISQIVQYPNPARRRMFIRMSANRSDVTEDMIKVKIYDVSGHKVRNLYGIKPALESWGINSRYLYDIPWDLKTESGKTVANGVYYAKIEIRDPDNPAKKIKRTQKLAVLR